jgi:hypothetical protein
MRHHPTHADGHRDAAQLDELYVAGVTPQDITLVFGLAATAARRRSR